MLLEQVPSVFVLKGIALLLLELLGFILAGCTSTYSQLLPLFGNVESLWTTSNTGINGVFIYNITGEPSSVNHSKKIMTDTW